MAGGEMRLATVLGNFLIEPATSWAGGRGFDGAISIQDELYEPLGVNFPGDRLWNISAISMPMSPPPTMMARSSPSL